MRNVSNLLFSLAVIFFFCTGFEPKPVEPQNSSLISHLRATKAPVAQIKIINTFPHDPLSYTEGLVYHNGYLYESTGRYGKSFLKKIDIETGKTIKEIKLGPEYFGEGMAILDNKIYQLTWQNQTGFIYDLAGLRQEGNFSYSGEGWGLTNDGKLLIMSNGTSVLTFIHPKTLQSVRRIIVRDGNWPVSNLNELELIRGEIWANIFCEDIIVRISLQTGKVLGWIDLRRLQTLLSKSEKRDVLNGIAYDPDGDRIFVTGKNWPNVFEIKIENKKEKMKSL